MATPRLNKPRRSAIGSLLEAGDAATSPVPAGARPAARRGSRYRKRQIILDEHTDAALHALTESLRRVTGTRLTTSHAARAVLRAIEPALPRLSMATAPIEATCLPNNAARFADDRARFEQALRHLIGEALRATG